MRRLSTPLSSIVARDAFRVHFDDVILQRVLERHYPELDAGWYADVLLAPLGPGLYVAHRRQYGVDAGVLVDRVVELARRTVG